MLVTHTASKNYIVLKPILLQFYPSFFIYVHIYCTITYKLLISSGQSTELKRTSEIFKLQFLENQAFDEQILFHISSLFFHQKSLPTRFAYYSTYVLYSRYTLIV